ncbi:hypothetical protein [Hydrogenophaga sp. 5NK40-0174]|uniref:hypothetical protein n=1 Tax=Hydrogenophaga sp. 5NK40-0174 TaxID=3127649 RepID=UPI00310AF955
MVNCEPCKASVAVARMLHRAVPRRAAVVPWSFDVRVADILRFEDRNTLSLVGKGIGRHGILLHDGDSIQQMHKAACWLPAMNRYLH